VAIALDDLGPGAIAEAQITWLHLFTVVAGHFFTAT